MQKRSSFFFNSTAIAGAFGGLLATAIGKLDGVRGYRAWRWIFILGMKYYTLPLPGLMIFHNRGFVNLHHCCDPFLFDYGFP